MELVQPGIGLIIWMTIAFSLLLWILAKFAWKPIMKGLKEREQTIEEALNTANKAREEMKELKFTNEQLLKEAKEERDLILRDARKVKESIIESARVKANEEGNRIIENAREAIERLLRGSPHSSVYKFLEKKRSDMKRVRILGE